ncbi:MAG TPA: hypothetical protein VLF62_00440 [Candidatus Saccharimonadales bacterium]|nr:hypothetical protein [Candidatus Saccharimonadales bacterium]
MLLGDIHFPDAMIEAQLAANRQEFLGGADPLYVQLGAQTAEAAVQFAEPQKRALVGLMPVAYFGIRAAIQTVQQPEVAPLLPASVERRSDVIRGCSKLAITRALRSGTLKSHYMQSDTLAPLVTNDPRKVLAKILNPEETVESGLTSLGDVAIMDEAIVAGGALRFLKRSAPEALQAEPAAAIVGRSVGLQLVARVPDEKLDVMRTHLGMPYTNHRYLTYNYGAVDFTTEARDFLHSLRTPGAGCPAHQALTQETSGQPTFLRHVWADLAEALLPPHAKADLPPQKRPPSSKKKKR